MDRRKEPQLPLLIQALSVSVSLLVIHITHGHMHFITATFFP